MHEEVALMDMQTLSRNYQDASPTAKTVTQSGAQTTAISAELRSGINGGTEHMIAATLLCIFESVCREKNT